MNKTELSEVILKKLLTGNTFQSIGDELGYSKQYMHLVLMPNDRRMWNNHLKQKRLERAHAIFLKKERRKKRLWINKPEDRFWENVNIGNTDQCWEWKLLKFPGNYNYGRVFRWGNNIGAYAHRVAWGLKNGSIPSGMHICHTCDNPPCCNPNHLFLGTPRDNTLDSISKGRRKGSGGISELTKEQAKEIKNSYVSDNISFVSLGKQYSLSATTIRRIINDSILGLK